LYMKVRVKRTETRDSAQRARARASQTMLVHGASGGVGIAAVQIGLALGLRVIGTAGTQRGLALLRELGCSDALDHHVRSAARRSSA
jgi:NADPH2:quinone reductase